MLSGGCEGGKRVPYSAERYIRQQSTYPSIAEGGGSLEMREKEAEVDDEEEVDIKDRKKVKVYCPILSGSAFYEAQHIRAEEI